LILISIQITWSDWCFKEILALCSTSVQVYTDIDGYELLIYKNIYYLKNEITNDIYDIIDYKPVNKVGIINEKGKIKLK
jgi:hypothetical protein